MNAAGVGAGAYRKAGESLKARRGGI